MRRMCEWDDCVETRSAAHLAVGLQYLTSFLRGHICMSVGLLRDLFVSPVRLGKAGATGKVRSQHQGVDKKSNHFFCLIVVASGGGSPHRDVILSAIAVKQCLKGGQRNHK